MYPSSLVVVDNCSGRFVDPCICYVHVSFSIWKGGGASGGMALCHSLGNLLFANGCV